MPEQEAARIFVVSMLFFYWELSFAIPLSCLRFSIKFLIQLSMIEHSPIEWNIHLTWVTGWPMLVLGPLQLMFQLPRLWFISCHVRSTSLRRCCKSYRRTFDPWLIFAFWQASDYHSSGWCSPIWSADADFACSMRLEFADAETFGEKKSIEKRLKDDIEDPAL